MMKICGIFLAICVQLFASKGIVVSLNDRYAKECFPSLIHLRKVLRCTLPIEIWHSGDELSLEMQKQLLAIEEITFRDIAQETNTNPLHYRGWQIKPKMMELSAFDEVLLMDGDLYFFENPEILFSHPKYLETGAFFFRDRTFCTYPFVFGEVDDDRFLEESYQRRKGFIQSKVACPSRCIPEDLHHFWRDETLSEKRPLLSELQESGCVVIDKARHKEGLTQTIILNENHQETYRYVYGDKETFWIGFEMAGEPYYMNEEVPLGLYVMKKRSDKKAKRYVHIMQFLDGKLFFQQKNPIRIEGYAYFIDEYSSLKRPLTGEELGKIKLAHATKTLFYGK